MERSSGLKWDEVEDFTMHPHWLRKLNTRKKNFLIAETVVKTARSVFGGNMPNKEILCPKSDPDSKSDLRPGMLEKPHF
jgi:hypothetical protein